MTIFNLPRLSVDIDLDSWMLFGQVGVSICLVALFAVPASIGLTAQYVYFLIFYTSLNAIFYTANGIAYSALTALITKNAYERVQLGSFRFMFAVATNIVIGFAVTLLVEKFGGGAAGWRATAMVFAIVALVVNTISCLSVKEVSDESVVDKKGENDDKIGFVESFKILAKNKYYLIIVAIYIVYYIMSNLVTGSGVFFATFVLGDEGIFGMLNMMKMFPVIIALIISPIIIKKVGNMQKVNTAAYGISCLLGIVLCIYYQDYRRTHGWYNVQLLITWCQNRWRYRYSCSRLVTEIRRIRWHCYNSDCRRNQYDPLDLHHYPGNHWCNHYTSSIKT